MGAVEVVPECSSLEVVLELSAVEIVLQLSAAEVVLKLFAVELVLESLASEVVLESSLNVVLKLSALVAVCRKFPGLIKLHVLRIGRLWIGVEVVGKLECYFLSALRGFGKFSNGVEMGVRQFSREVAGICEVFDV